MDAGAQRGGPPAARARGIERLDAAADRVIGRFTMELWGPVPVGQVAVRARVLRPGRSVALAESELYDVGRDRVAAVGRASLFPQATDGPSEEDRPLADSPADGSERPRPPDWHGGYLDAIEWRWIKGGVDEAGPGVVSNAATGLGGGRAALAGAAPAGVRRLGVGGAARHSTYATGDSSTPS